ncbi:LysE family translocator [Actinoplanes sp. TRM 88003]|uniref:LysE family translocator n=1 Tax=Paractinoplanes aksuensis TaxID=2939490 RepID=A0ABT1DFS5_9ACTN|nr:LysE family translocator [Actinoplanes aksuensis]MCO8269694.1 LysE family translocator [Actinoplanes aksuensis]
MTIAALWSFVLVVGLLTLTPGLDTALILRTASIRSARQAWGVVLGIQTGTLVWGVLASAGITALLTASHVAYEVVRWAGVAYLVWMGARMLWSSWRREPQGDGEPALADTAGFVTGWRRGLLTNLLNPKVGAFYMALLPQFIPAGATPLFYGILLAGVHVALGLLWSTVLVATARRLRTLLSRPRARRLLDRVTGVVIVAFGVRLATEAR